MIPERICYNCKHYPRECVPPHDIEVTSCVNFEDRDGNPSKRNKPLDRTIKSEI